MLSLFLGTLEVVTVLFWTISYSPYPLIHLFPAGIRNQLGLSIPHQQNAPPSSGPRYFSASDFRIRTCIISCGILLPWEKRKLCENHIKLDILRTGVLFLVTLGHQVENSGWVNESKRKPPELLCKGLLLFTDGHPSVFAWRNTKDYIKKESVLLRTTLAHIQYVTDTVIFESPFESSIRWPRLSLDVLPAEKVVSINYTVQPHIFTPQL